MKYSPLILIIAILFPTLLFGEEGKEDTCTYRTYKWNVNLKKAVEYRTVRHSYSELREDEIDNATGCTVCEEDQKWIDIYPLDQFRICNKIAGPVREALSEIIRTGEPIYDIAGYRVGMTRGEIDKDGNRTQFSNHSFGIAFDINSEQNGLYDHCVEFGPHCRLMRGGHWIPEKPGSLTLDSVTVNILKSAGFSWGGEIKGKQKDFMHFSPSGY
ncbi:MAG: M15 family metallopeptidase [Proteobacteria bacterium]|nr:M15 family metallopeptidase [Pseudomonadota bacterium]